MEAQSASTASSSPPHASLQSSITAENGAVVLTPQMVGCICSNVNITQIVNTYHPTAEAHQPALCEACQTAHDMRLSVSKKLKSNLGKKYKIIFEGIAKRGNPAVFREMYTELYITEGETEGVNKDHEVLQIDPAFKTPTKQDRPINCNAIFRPFHQEDLVGNTEDDTETIRTVLTKGVAGIGKTVSVQKFILDWAEGKANQDIELLFVLPFRELNSIERKCSLHQLLLDFHPQLKELEDVKYYDNCKSLFIFDGLDESKLPFDFKDKRVSNITESASLDELITNIIKGNLLPSALVWITSRPAAIDNVPRGLIHRMTEVRGFTDSQKEQYFQKSVKGKRLANRIISHVRDVRSLEIMCHIPVFCWIVVRVLEDMLKSKGERIPSSLTEMYTRFLLVQTNRRETKKDSSRLSDADVEIILKLGKLAFEELVKHNIVFSEDDLRLYGINSTEASVRSGVFTEIVREEDPIFPVKKYSFVHLSFQEYLAAFFVFYKFAVEGISLIPEAFRSVASYDMAWCCKEAGLMPHDAAPDAPDAPVPAVDDKVYDDDMNRFEFKQGAPRQNLTLYELQRDAIHNAIKRRSGWLDLFVRFLLGLSKDCCFLKSINLKVENLHIDKNIDKTRKFINSLFRDEYEGQTPSSGRCINLFHCLLELDDHSMAEEIQRCVAIKEQTGPRLTAAQCSTLAYSILKSEEVLEELDLNKFNASEEARRRLVPAVRNCRKALMAGCNLTQQSYDTVASVLQDPDTPLRELDLSRNVLLTKVHKSLLPGLKRLENLNISHISLGRSGASILRAVLMDPESQLHTLKLCACYITDECAAILLSAFQSSTCRLKELDISSNSLTPKGVELVLQGLQSPSCTLEVLRLSGSEISTEHYTYLVSALKRSFLRELILDNCSIGDAGIKLLCPGLMSPHCKLQMLSLSGCLISKEGCCSLASALRSSVLRELDLSYNHPGDEGAKLLSDLQHDPCSTLQTLRLDHGGQSRLTAGLWKYYQELNIDNTHNLICSQDQKGIAWRPKRKRSSVWGTPASRHEDTSGKAYCREKLTGGRFYFEVQWAGLVTIVLKEVKGKSLEISLNKDHNYLYYTKQKDVRIEIGKCLESDTFGVYLDLPGGTVSLYSIYNWGMKRFYTFHTTFNEPVTPEFWLEEPRNNSDVSSIIIVTQSPDSVQRTTADLTEQLLNNN